MEKKIFSSKKTLFLLLSILVIFLSIFFNIAGIKDRLNEHYPNFKLVKELISKKSILENLNNDYNVRFLPNTQFVKLDFEKKKLNFPKNLDEDKSETNKIKYGWYKSFYIELIENNILIISYLGKIYKTNIKDALNREKDSLDLKEISSNLSVVKVLDTFIYDDYLYVSFIGLKNNCKNLNIAIAKTDTLNLNFENFFASKECGDYILGGRMQFYKHNDSKGLLLTTSNHPNNLPDDKPQNEDSIFGKILFIDFKEKKPIFFSKGHRVAQGLYAEKNLILSTEHGPRGGDEINRIIFNKNYGWPIASYGGKYDVEKPIKPNYFKNHSSLGFEEPIFAFVPSIGISEIIKLPNNFSDNFVDNFFVSSLNGRSLYRIKFNENYTKVIFNEKIFIGERIRDLKYYSKMNIILLALEEKGKLGILSKN